MKQKQILSCCLLLAGITLLSSCSTVKEYQKNKINDSEINYGDDNIPLAA